MKKLFFLRHFKTKVDKNKPVAEWELDDDGKKEMISLISSDRFKDIDKIYTSPELKAKITALKISQKYGIPVVECKEIAEIDRSKAGFIEGDYLKLVKDYFNFSKFDYAWENKRQVIERAGDFLKKISVEKGNILVISHGMFLSILLHKYFNKNIIDFWKNLRFGEIMSVDYVKLNKHFK